MEKRIPRGLRNHNPLNIKIGNDWHGEKHPNTDGVFEQFTADYFGYRAAFIILRKYITRYGRDTIRKIVHSWSPDGASIEANYMKAVCQFTGKALDDHINFYDKVVMCHLVQGMAHVENGCDIPLEPIEVGYEMAIN